MLIVQDSDITGPVRTTGASTVSICGSHLNGPVRLVGTTGGVAVGDTTNACDPSTIEGPLWISGTSGPVVADRTEIHGKVALTSNTSSQATVLSGAAVVDGGLACAKNAVAPTDSGVTMTVDGPRSGQCAVG